jgi:hypothetical protein
VQRLVEQPLEFEIVGPIEGATTFARGFSIRCLKRLRRSYGEGNWRKRKGFATLRFPGGFLVRAELHWYEAHGIGKREIKVKHLLQ